jgi:hypothetical protein
LIYRADSEGNPIGYQAIDITTGNIVYSFTPENNSYRINKSSSNRDNNIVYPDSVCCSPLNPSLIVGCTYTGQIVTWDGFKWVLSESTIPNNPTFCQISIDTDGYTWVCVKEPAYAIYRSEEPSSVVLNTTPITSNVNIANMSINCQARYQSALNKLMWLIAQYITILAGARLRFVGINN